MKIIITIIAAALTVLLGVHLMLAIAAGALIAGLAVGVYLIFRRLLETGLWIYLGGVQVS